MFNSDIDFEILCDIFSSIIPTICMLIINENNYKSALSLLSIILCLYGIIIIIGENHENFSSIILIVNSSIIIIYLLKLLYDIKINLFLDTKFRKNGGEIIIMVILYFISESIVVLLSRKKKFIYLYKIISLFILLGLLWYYKVSSFVLFLYVPLIMGNIGKDRSIYKNISIICNILTIGLVLIYLNSKYLILKNYSIRKIFNYFRKNYLRI